MKKNIVIPSILKGTREFGPREMAKRDFVMKKMIKIFSRFGYDPIETPVLNPAETLLGKYGEEGDRLTYTWEDNGGRRVALPYDLTVPFARFVAANWRALPMPFKRYQIQRVWRAEKPQKGRLREFYQCDIDVIGTKNVSAEAEIARVIIEVFQSIGLKDVVVQVNSRRLLDAVLERFEIAEAERIKVLRAIDKLEKIGPEEVVTLLAQSGVKKAEDLMRLLEPAQSNEETLKKLSVFDISEIKEFLSLCRAFGVSEEYVRFNPSLARGLDYYTGIVFEVTPFTFPLVRGRQSKGGIGTLCAGGRYDNLCGMFCEEEFSGVGVSFGFERIMMALDAREAFPAVGVNTQVLVANFGDEYTPDAIAIMNLLIVGGVRAEIYFDPAKLEKQFKYADKKQIPFVVMYGSEERERGEVKVKIMDTGKQKAIPRNQLVAYLTGYQQNGKGKKN